jgi:CDP-glycerol glycerophosphotransferase
LEAGYPRNDCLYDPQFVDSTNAEVRRSYGIPPDARVILYAPTFREYEDEFTSHVNWSNVLNSLPEDTYVMVRSHHSYGSVRDEAHARLVNVSRHRLVEELYATADILVTDYSSVMFDYANLGRPIVIVADDIEKYEKYRGFYFDIREELGSVVVSNDRDLTKMLATCAYESTEAKRELADFRDKYCPFDDGSAAERVVRTMFQLPDSPLVAAQTSGHPPTRIDD